MSILIIGAKGNMGARYSAILRYLGQETVGADIGDNRHYVKGLAEKAEGIIICSPTNAHVGNIRDVIASGKPILCEKPVTKNIEELKAIALELKAIKCPFRMVFQYQLMANKNRIGRSHYDYFKHGSDGLAWDCLQVIALSRTAPTLGESSPVWRCMVNGKALSIAHMDAAYIAYLQTWFKYPSQDMEEIIDAHVKTDEMAKGMSLGSLH